MKGLTGRSGSLWVLHPAWRGCAMLHSKRAAVRPLSALDNAKPPKARIKVSPLSSLDEELQQQLRQLDLSQALQGLLERDDFKESSRPFFRTQFDHERWVSHRSTSRYARHMLGIARSRMVRGLAQPLLYVMGVATAVAAYESLYQAHLLPSAWPDLELHSKEPFGLTSFALSLLLVFRTNASYSRWLDARKAWGLVINRTRDIVRQGLSYIPPDQSQLHEMLCRWTPAFSRALMCHIRQESDLERELQGLLLEHELESLMAAEHRPNFVLQVLSQILDEAKVSTPAALRMDENLSIFEDCLGTCERILKTPIPLSYTRHTSRFMIIWLTLLPFMLWENCHWAIVPLCAIIAFLLLGIEEIGVSIEEPFSIMALEALCDTALHNVRELQSMHGGGAGEAAPDGNGISRRVFSAAQLVAMGGAGGGKQAGSGTAGVHMQGAAEVQGQAAEPWRGVGVLDHEGEAEALALSNARLAGDLAVDGVGDAPQQRL